MTNDLLQWLQANHYKDLRELSDGTIVGTIDLTFTRGLCVDMDRWGYGHRYCYEDREQATRACNAMLSGDDKPLPGFVAQRHRP